VTVISMFKKKNNLTNKKNDLKEQNTLVKGLGERVLPEEVKKLNDLTNEVSDLEQNFQNAQNIFNKNLNLLCKNNREQCVSFFKSIAPDDALTLLTLFENECINKKDIDMCESGSAAATSLGEFREKEFVKTVCKNNQSFNKVSLCSKIANKKMGKK
jgi:hypothetical protein